MSFGSLNVAMPSVRYNPKVRDFTAEILEAATRKLSEPARLYPSSTGSLVNVRPIA